ncbi:unnamed protein product [Didymodactylos carnosus]|uniref:Uncharacterized protein n=1 Tax=Didymodactylos carnosus TaxID=1234261 RepID=A0A814MK69_9BILA|nr:unnamed protein product [Didymodactylos carnosus]CAF1079805.1 unnamed protein product [Didymodactylos carnosus]CAF3661002.1 unnamed protein product [Didymodactylos carnosus]CAF3845856.1 unnamed protein product [Didymodactylos carnosus]
MSQTDVRYPPNPTGSSSPVVSPQYGSSIPNPPVDDGPVRSKMSLNPSWFKTIHGILTVVTIIALTCVIISAGVAKRQDCSAVDTYAHNAKLNTTSVSAVHTRNAVLTFAIIGLILALADLIVRLFSLNTMYPSRIELIVIYETQN